MTTTPWLAESEGTSSRYMDHPAAAAEKVTFCPTLNVGNVWAEDRKYEEGGRRRERERDTKENGEGKGGRGKR